MRKTWNEVYSEAKDAVVQARLKDIGEFYSSVAIPLYSVELSRWIYENYDPVMENGRRVYQFKADGK